MSNPSLEHEGLLLLFRHRITLGPECVRDLLRVPLPTFDTIDIADTQIAQVVAANRAPDLVLALRDRSGQAVRVVVVEIQRGIDRGKEYSWPLYIPALRATWIAHARKSGPRMPRTWRSSPSKHAVTSTRSASPSMLT